MRLATSFAKLGQQEMMFWLHTSENPTREEWDLHIDRLRDYKRNHGDTVAGLRSLVFTDGVAPGSREREVIFKDIFGDARNIRFAAVSIGLVHPFLRGLATVIAWLQPGFKAFQPSDIKAALAYLEIGAYATEVIAAFDSLQPGLPPNQTLQQVRRALGMDEQERPTV